MRAGDVSCGFGYSGPPASLSSGVGRIMGLVSRTNLDRTAVLLTGALLAIAGWQWWTSVIAASTVQYAGESITFNCGAIFRLHASIIMLGLSIAAALPAFWFSARRLGLAWRLYHLCLLTVGCGLVSFFWWLPLVSKTQ